MQRASARASAGAAPAPASASNKPKETDFNQQRLRSWQPILTPKWLFVAFSAIGVVFVTLGIILWVENAAKVELRFTYDGPNGASADTVMAAVTAGQCAVASPTNVSAPPALCSITFTPNADMKAPVFVYYELSNFYQNHRRYVRSKSDKQLAGTVVTDAGSTELSDCDPLRTITETIGGIQVTRVLHPCGLIANSFFNGA